MKSSTQLQNSIFFIAILISIFSFSCSEEQVFPELKQEVVEEKLTSRTTGNNCEQCVRIKVSQRDHIPLAQILTCTFYGMTPQGHYEWHLTTIHNGPKIFIVTSIIGDDCEGA